MRGEEKQPPLTDRNHLSMLFFNSGQIVLLVKMIYIRMKICTEISKNPRWPTELWNMFTE